MFPVDFPEGNIPIGPPADFTEEQVRTIRGYIGTMQGGNCDGQDIVVVAWRPTEEQLIDLATGAPIFLTCFGGLPPHMLTTNFHDATHAA